MKDLPMRHSHAHTHIHKRDHINARSVFDGTDRRTNTRIARTEIRLWDADGRTFVAIASYARSVNEKKMLISPFENVPEYNRMVTSLAAADCSRNRAQ